MSKKAAKAEKAARLQTKACADRLSVLLQLPPNERNSFDFQEEIALFEKRLSALENSQAAVIELTEETDLENLISDYEHFLVEQTSVLRSAKTTLKSLLSKIFT